jgi:outer membrane protein assembly factor BamB
MTTFRIAWFMLCAPLLGQTPRRPRLLWKFPLQSNSFGGAAAADVDGDGRLEIAFATYFGDSCVRVVRGVDGSPVWTWRGKQQCLDASVRFADLDGDGQLELVAPVSNTALVLAFDARTGKERWRYAAGAGECIDTPPAILDVDGDQRPEVVVGTFAGRLHVVRGTDGSRVQTIKAAPGAVQSCPWVHDLDGDGVLDFVVGNFRGDHRIHAVSGKDGSELWHVQTGDHTYHGVAAGELGGELTLVACSYDGKAYGIRARDGKVLFTVATGDRYIMSPAAMADLDGDGKSEVIIASQHVTVLRADGTKWWSKRIGSGIEHTVTRGVSVADLDGDGSLDLAYVTDRGLFQAMRGRDGVVLYEFDGAAVHHRESASSCHGPLLADLDGDGRLDAFFVVGGDNEDRHGSALCITGFLGTGEGWYQFRHDARNTGNVATALDPALRGRLPRTAPGAGAQKPAAAPAAAAPAPAAPTVTEPGFAALASERKVPEAALRAAFAASQALVGRGDRQETMAALEKHGPHAFPAVVALVTAGKNHYRMVDLLAATWRPGDERLLLELAEGPALPEFGLWSVLEGLGVADTKEVRDYLAGRLEREEDAGLFFCAARGLARLKDPRGVAPVAKRLLEFGEGWSGVEGYLLTSLVEMDGKTAAPHVEQYLADLRSRHVGMALRSLDGIDHERAVAAARKLEAQRDQRRFDAETRRLIESLR